MRIKPLLITVLFCLSAASASSQQIPVTEANYDLAERFSPNRVNKMVFSQTINPTWFPSSDRFWYKWQTPEGTEFWIVDPSAKTKKKVFDMDRLAMELTSVILDPFDAQHIPFMNLRLKDENTFTFEIKSSIDVPAEQDSTSAVPEKTVMEKKIFRFEYDIRTGQLTDVTDKEKKKEFPEWANISPDSSFVVYAKGYNLYWTDMENLRKFMADESDSTFVEHALTTDGSKDVAYGGNDYTGVEDRDTCSRYYVYLSWSPDSRYFAHQKYDMSGIGELWVINSTASPRPVLETYKYQMPGEPGPKSYLMLFDMDNMTSRVLDVSEFKDQTVTVHNRPAKNRDVYNDYNPTVWLGDGNSFYFTRISRDEHRADICRYWITGDSVQVLIKERLNTYIDVCDFELVEETGEIIMRSERNGWAQLYLHDRDGRLVRPLTDGAYHVSTIAGTDPETRMVYFTATCFDKNENPYYNHLFSVSMDGKGAVRMLNPGDFDNRSHISDDNRFFVNNASRVDTAPSNALYSTSGRKIMDLETADLSRLLMAGYRFPEIFKAKAADGITDLWGVIYKPFDFDSTRLYPIIEYVYPGPQVEATEYFWTSRMNRIDRLAQLGFIVVTVGHRGGHPDRSKWYHNFGYGNMRDYPLADHKYVLQQLASQRKYMDINKVGIHGHSGGGFMSTAAILTYPDFYKAAVSCAGNHDNSIYNRWWSETHHGVKENVSAEGDTTFHYSIDVNQDFVKNLKGHLLLVHGDMDDNVHPANTTRVVNALIRANKRFEMLYLPGQRHGFGDMDEYFFWKMADFFSRWLIGDYEDDVDIRQMNNN